MHRVESRRDVLIELTRTDSILTRSLLRRRVVKSATFSVRPARFKEFFAVPGPFIRAFLRSPLSS